MLFSEMCKIMLNKVTFVGLREAVNPITPAESIPGWEPIVYSRREQLAPAGHMWPATAFSGARETIQEKSSNLEFPPSSQCKF